MSPSRKTEVIGVASGKGGVGKTTVSINLATALAQQGQRVMLFDADLGLANAQIALGARAEYNLSHFLSGQKTLAEIVLTTRQGIRLIQEIEIALRKTGRNVPINVDGALAAVSGVAEPTAGNAAYAAAKSAAETWVRAMADDTCVLSAHWTRPSSDPSIGVWTARAVLSLLLENSTPISLKIF